MSRRRRAEKREILVDPKFGDRVLSKFMNCLMLDGKKSLAEGIVYGAFDRIQSRGASDPVRAFHDALGQREAGGRGALAPRWRGNLPGADRGAPGARPGAGHSLADFRVARKRSELTMTERLAGELMDASNNRGAAVKKREDTHRMAEANKAFSHYRW